MPLTVDHPAKLDTKVYWTILLSHCMMNCWVILRTDSMEETTAVMEVF
jgi:hypothetical protein